MNIALVLLIVSIEPLAPTESRYPEGHEVFACDFGQRWDQDYDGWPDRWSRKRSAGFPEYLSIKIDEAAPGARGRAVRIDLDGGAAAIYAPEVPADSLYGYVLEGDISTAGLKNDEAFLSLTFLDAEGNREVCFSEKTKTPSPRRLRLGPVAPTAANVRSAVVGLHLEPAGEADLRGSAWFSNLWLARLPRLELEAANAHHLFPLGEPIAVRCRASGFAPQQALVDFSLEDVFGRTLARSQQKLADPAATLDLPVAPPQPGDSLPLVGTAEWIPEVPGPGFYRLSVSMPSLLAKAAGAERAAAHRRDLTLAVIEPFRPLGRGEFGWSVAEPDKPLALGDMAYLLSQSGVHWLKYPLWLDPQADPLKSDRLVQFNDRLIAAGMRVVGVLAEPPDPLGAKLAAEGAHSAAAVFTRPAEAWYPSIEPLLMQMGSQVDCWQLGRDRDFSFVDYPELENRIAAVRSQFSRIGQSPQLGFAWRWTNPAPVASVQAPWRFLSLSANPSLAAGELPPYLDGLAGGEVARWVDIEPLDRRVYTTATRIEDLVARMLAAKQHGAEGVFVTAPFDDNTGVMRGDGTPSELFLPWRTTARMLAGTTFLGSVRLPAGSKNLVFGRDDRAVMAVWSAEDGTREELSLGEKLRRSDLWGRSQMLAEGPRTAIGVGKEPVFVEGLDKTLVAWELDTSFSAERLPSVFGRPQKNSLRLTNHFAQDISGSAVLIVPDDWKVSPERLAFQLAPAETAELPLEIVFPADTTSGRHAVRIDFEVESGRPQAFSVYRGLDVGLGDIYIEVATRMNAAGELEVEQRFVNEGRQAVNFRCNLFAPNRRRQKLEVIGLGAGRDVQVYRFEQGHPLIGQRLWLRAEEIGGPRVLNYRFTAEGGSIVLEPPQPIEKRGSEDAPEDAGGGLRPEQPQ